MCATIAATAVQITKTQIAMAMAAEITDIVSSFAFMILLFSSAPGCIRGTRTDGGYHERRKQPQRRPAV